MAKSVKHTVQIVDLLHKIKSLIPSERVVFLSKLSVQKIKLLCEVVKNIILGNVPLPNKVLNQVKNCKALAKRILSKIINKIEKIKLITSAKFNQFLCITIPYAIEYLTSADS